MSRRKDVCPACKVHTVPYAKVGFVKAVDLPDSERGTDGYGSTGVL